MSKTMLVNVTHVEESRVAVLDDGVLDAYDIETINRTSLKGNIHNAVVESVHPSLEAAFVKIGTGPERLPAARRGQLQAAPAAQATTARTVASASTCTSARN